MPASNYFHFYPFDPRGPYGGSMRVAFAADATARAGHTTQVYWWEDDPGRWHGPLDPKVVGSGLPAARGGGQPVQGAMSRLVSKTKRDYFPSALWESRRHAIKAGPWSEFSGEDHLVLHTSMLSPIVPKLRDRGLRVAVDVHDLVYRVHAIDAEAGKITRRAARSIYSRTVAPREIRGLAAAHAVLFAGWEDHRVFQTASPHTGAIWAPTGLSVTKLGRLESAKLRVGMIGNFAHSATSQPAEALAASPLAVDPEVELVFAGLGSEAWKGRAGVTALGAVDSIREFYERVDAMVVPVTNGSGMKTKLAEAALAGCPVVTTSAGAEGYPPELRERFLVVDDTNELTAATIRRVIDRGSTNELREAFLKELGPDTARHTYQLGLAALESGMA